MGIQIIEAEKVARPKELTDLTTPILYYHHSPNAAGPNLPAELSRGALTIDFAPLLDRHRRAKLFQEVKCVAPLPILFGGFGGDTCLLKRLYLCLHGRLAARFAALRVRIADGAPQRIGAMGAQHLPGEEAWLIGEHRSTGERKYYLSNLPADTPLKQLAGAIKARWICEQAHQQLKEELGLDHFEGRSWTGLHRHAPMTMIAYAFLQARRLERASRKKRIEGPPPQPSLPAIRAAIIATFATAPIKCPHCRKLISTRDLPK